MRLDNHPASEEDNSENPSSTVMHPPLSLSLACVSYGLGAIFRPDSAP